jgi:dienelactone hydrolase
MAWIEVALVGVGWVGVWMASEPRMRAARYSYCAIAAVTLMKQVADIGVHWQVAPAYLALGLALLVMWAPLMPWVKTAAGGLATVAGGATLMLLWVVPLFALPAPTGGFAVGTTGPLHWVDASRNLRGEAGGGGRRRELEVQVWYPATTAKYGKKATYARARELSPAHSYEAVIRTNSALNAPIVETAGAFPVLVFGHAWGGSRTQDTFLAEDLASHGYVVVAMDHPLNAARVEMADGAVVRTDRAGTLDRLEASTAPVVEAAWGREMGIWVADDRFVLDRLFAETGFQGRLDADRVGAFGHSFGGAVSTALLGVDKRVKCAVNLDGWTFQGLDHRTTEPILEVYTGDEEARHAVRGVEDRMDADDQALVDASLARYGGWRAYVRGTQHGDFTDLTLKSPVQRITGTGPIAGERARGITRGLVLGFFDRVLKGVGDVPEYPEVRLERFSGEG